MIFLLTATCGRHQLIERSAGMFLAQDCTLPCTQIIFNNSTTPQELDISYDTSNKRVILINSCKGDYKNLGEIYNDLLTKIPSHLPYLDIVSHFDDDDIILPNHISKGIEGYDRALDVKKIAYKPKKSYYKSPEGISLVENTMEPSMFLSVATLKHYKYRNTTSDQHLSWVEGIGNRIYVDEFGEPTLVYQWGNEVPTFKTSGNPTNPNNFKNYRDFSQDHGDKVITPWGKDRVNNLYKELYKQIEQNG